MDRRVTVVAVAALVVALLAGAIAVVAVATGGDAAASNGPTTVSVGSRASVGTSPDEAVLTVEVLAEAPDSSTAYDQGQQDTDAVLAAVQGAGVARKDIQTTDVGLDRVVKDRKTPQERTVYVARNRLAITVKDLSTVGDVVSASVDGGADRIEGVRFQVSDQAAARDQALAAAIRGARAKAETMASAAGADLGGVVRIEEGNVSTPVYEQRVSYAAAGAAVPSAIVPPDQLTTSVTVTVVWSLS